MLKQVDPADLILMSRKPEKLGHYAQLGCAVRFGDYEQPESVEAAAQGAQKMLMISGHMVGYRIPQHSAAIDAAKRAGVGHIVYTSYYGSVEGNTALVCKDHCGTEQKLRESGIHWTAMRDGMYAETVTTAMLPLALRTGRWVHSAGNGKSSFADREDCVDCAVKVLTTPGHEDRVYNITGSELYSFAEIAALAEEITGRKIEMVEVTDEELFAQLIARGIPADAKKEFDIDGFAWCAEDMVSSDREIRLGSFAIASHDIETLLGRPSHSFRQHMWDHAAELRAYCA